MKIFSKSKDGGPNSPVDGYFLIEIKSLFSIAVLKFNKGAREEFHTHAFDAYTWFITGDLKEEDVDGDMLIYQKNLKPKFTPRDKNHRVIAQEDSYCFTIRGPWSRYWAEVDKKTNTQTVFTWGRKIVAQTNIK